MSAAVAGLVGHLTNELPVLAEADRTRLGNLAVLAVRCRSVVDRDGYSREIVAVPGAEQPARLAKQVAKLYGALQLIGCDRNEAWAIVARVGLDSMPAGRRKVLDLLGAKGDGAVLSTAQVGVGIGLPTGTARRHLEDLEAHGVVDRFGADEKKHTWMMSEWCRRAGRPFPKSRVTTTNRQVIRSFPRSRVTTPFPKPRMTAPFRGKSLVTPDHYRPRFDSDELSRKVGHNAHMVVCRSTERVYTYPARYRFFGKVPPVTRLSDFAKAVATVETLGGTIYLDGAEVVVHIPDGVPPQVTAAFSQDAVLLRHVAAGRLGPLRIVLGICGICGEPCMVTVTKARRTKHGKWPTCRMTPDCTGRHLPVDRDLEQ